MRHNRITPRQLQIADLIQEGFTNKEIAERLGIKVGTVKVHVGHLFDKTGVRSRGALAVQRFLAAESAPAGTLSADVISPGTLPCSFTPTTEAPSSSETCTVPAPID